MDSIPLPLLTERLRLRPYRDSDVEALLPMYSREDVSRYLLSDPWTAEVARTEIARRRPRVGLETDARALALVVETSGTGMPAPEAAAQAVGVIALKVTAEAPTPTSPASSATASEVVGDVALWTEGADPTKAEIGWVFHPDHGGHGYATEAATAMLRVAFDHYRLRRVVAQMDARNTASARLAERIGMTREAHLRQDWWSKGEWTDTVVYGMLDSDPRAAG